MKRGVRTSNKQTYNLGLFLLNFGVTIWENQYIKINILYHIKLSHSNEVNSQAHDFVRDFQVNP